MSTLARDGAPRDQATVDGPGREVAERLLIVNRRIVIVTAMVPFGDQKGTR